MDKARVVTIFLSVVRAGSFSQAAVENGMTPQAVSKAVRQLEEHLGVRLFHRTTRKLSLTEEGARLSELADPGLRLLDEALDQVQNSRRDAEGIIRVSAPTSVGNLLLMPLVQKFQERYPNIHFDFLLDDRFTDLVAERVDIGFRTGKEPQRNLVARRLGDIILQIYAAPSYLEKSGRAVQAPLYRFSSSQQRQAVAVDADGGWRDGLSGDAGGGELQYHGVGSRRSAGRCRYRPTGCVLCARTGGSRQTGADSAALEQRVRRHVHVLSAAHADAAACAALHRLHH